MRNATIIGARTKSDLQIMVDVISELRFEPAIVATDIGIQVKGGIVILIANLATHEAKSHAMHAVMRIFGVRGVVDQITVERAGDGAPSDADIAVRAADRISSATSIPDGAALVIVRAGWVTLEGVVDWWYQRIAAEDALTGLAGISGVTNRITIKPELSPSLVHADIVAAFGIRSMSDAGRIEVRTHGGEIILAGTVANGAERTEAERVAWTAPGVVSVDNRLQLAWDWGMIL
jgi:osmotically-inducible protein OsmY